VDLKESLTEREVVDYWRFLMDEAIPAIMKVPGMRSAKCFSGAGGLRADLTIQFEMDDAGVYERMIADPAVQKIIPRTYGAWDMTTAGQSFRREITPELVRALGGPS
jgi:hypothetical protein